MPLNSIELPILAESGSLSIQTEQKQMKFLTRYLHQVYLHQFSQPPKQNKSKQNKKKKTKLFQSAFRRRPAS